MVAWGANGYRLPTKAEWEKAARGGLTGKRYPNGDTLELCDANFSTRRDAEFGSERCAIKEVKLYLPNGYGFYDMAGNVSEWCWDSRPAFNYKSGHAVHTDDPKGPAVGKYRVFCGGGAEDPKSHCEIGFYLENMDNNHGQKCLGFRVVRRAFEILDGVETIH
jgi:formylglycine-generating enzyme required for sulfatase activity